MTRTSEPHQNSDLALCIVEKAAKGIRQKSLRGSAVSNTFTPQQHLAVCKSPVYQVTCHFSPPPLHQAEDSRKVHPKISLSRKCHCSNSTLHYSGIPSQREEKSSTPKARHIPLFTLSSPHRATTSIRRTKQTVSY